MNSLLLLGRGGSSDSLLSVYWYHSTWREWVSHTTAPHVTSTDTTDGGLINAERRWGSSDTIRPPLTLSQWGEKLVPHTLTSSGSPSSPHHLTDATSAEELGALITAWQGSLFHLWWGKWKTGISGLLVSAVYIWGLWGKKKFQETPHHVVPQVSRSLDILPSLHTSVLCLLCI